MPRFAVILPAAGRSSRFGSAEKKVFAVLDGRAVWLRSAELFVARPDVCQCIVVAAPEDRGRFGAAPAGGRVEIADGGAERFQSVANALARTTTEAEFVAVHDAARPCLTPALIDAVFARAAETGAAMLAVRVADTVKRDDGRGRVVATVPREGLWLAQTPQVFRRDWLLDAYARRAALGSRRHRRRPARRGGRARGLPRSGFRHEFEDHDARRPGSGGGRAAGLPRVNPSAASGGVYPAVSSQPAVTEQRRRHRRPTANRRRACLVYRLDQARAAFNPRCASHQFRGRILVMTRTWLLASLTGGMVLTAAACAFIAWPAKSPADPPKVPDSAHVASAAAPAQADSAPQLPIGQVVLFSSGVGYFQREGTIDGDARVDLSFPTQDINDLIKSMVLRDLNGGHVSAVSYDSNAPVEKTLQSFAVNLSANPTFGQVLNQARGEKVEVVLQQANAAQPGTMTGAIMGVEKQKQAAGKDAAVEVEQLNLWCADGMSER